MATKKELALVRKFMEDYRYFKLIDYTETQYDNDWNQLMQVVEKIEGIIGHSVDIGSPIEITYWYSPKKTGTFPRGAGGGGGHTVERTPFEAIFGKLHSIYVYYQPERKFKVKKHEQANSKIAATLKACMRFIEWYNKTVKK